MAKRKVMAKSAEQPVCYHGKGCFALMGLALIALGVWAIWDVSKINIIIGLGLILFGIKKMFMAAKCC